MLIKNIDTKKMMDKIQKDCKGDVYLRLSDHWEINLKENRSAAMFLRRGILHTASLDIRCERAEDLMYILSCSEKALKAA